MIVDADNKLLDILHERSMSVINSIDPDTIRDIYVLSIYVNDEEDFPELRIGWNTNKQWHACSPKPGQKAGSMIASSAGEAKWNYAFWLQEESYILGGYPDDPDSDLKTKWLQEKGIDFNSDQLNEGEKGDRLRELRSKALWALATELSKRLRKDRRFDSILGGGFPILVHEVHMDGREAEFVHEANPNGEANDYFTWSAINPYTGKLEEG